MAADKNNNNDPFAVCDLNNNNDANILCNEHILSHANLCDLNDDCLLNIFEMVGITEWIRLSKTNQRFRSIISTQILNRRSFDFGAISQNHSIRKVLRMFGIFASSIKISTLDIQYQHERRSKAEELFHLLNKHCNAGKLRELSLGADFADLRAECVNEFSVQLTNIRHISIYWMHKCYRFELRTSEHDFVNRLLSHTKQVESIELIDIPLGGDLLHDSELVHLQKIAIVNCNTIDFGGFYDLMQRIGHQLQTFEWRNSKFNFKSKLCETILEACDVIGDCLPNLTALTFEMNYAQNYCQERTNRDTSIFDNLLKLCHLHTLKIGCAGACSCTNITFFVAKLTYIQNLAIASPLRYNNMACRPCSKELNENLGIIIANLSQLRGLRLAYVCKLQRDLLELIAKKVPLLQELHLIGYRMLYQQKLLDFLQKANELRVLNFAGTKFTFTVSLYNDIKHIIQERNTIPLSIYLDARIHAPLLDSLKMANQYDNRFVRIHSAE